MNCMNLRSTVFIFSLLFSSHLFAQDAALEKDKEKVLLQAIGTAQNIYSGSQKNALTVVAMKRNCLKAYPSLKEKIEAKLSSGNSGFDQKTKDEIKRLETSRDPYVKGQIDGAAIATYEKDLMEAGCKALAGMNP